MRRRLTAAWRWCVVGAYCGLAPGVEGQFLLWVLVVAGAWLLRQLIAWRVQVDAAISVEVVDARLLRRII